jgi:excisionase family DNA binding protein
MTARQALGLNLPQGTPPWLAAFIREALLETETLRENGADQAAAARTALLKRLVGASQAWLDAEMDTADAAQEMGVCEETIRRAIRDGRIPDRRVNPRGHHRVRRGDLNRVAESPGPPYDPITDAQSIAQLRRKL